MTFIQNEGWLVSQVADEVLMMNIERGDYVGLNDSGATIWALLETPRTLDQLVDLLLEQFDVNRDQATQDVDIFVKVALEKGIIRGISDN